MGRSELDHRTIVTGDSMKGAGMTKVMRIVNIAICVKGICMPSWTKKRQEEIMLWVTHTHPKMKNMSDQMKKDEGNGKVMGLESKTGNREQKTRKK